MILPTPNHPFHINYQSERLGFLYFVHCTPHFVQIYSIIFVS